MVRKIMQIVVLNTCLFTLGNVMLFQNHTCQRGCTSSGTSNEMSGRSLDTFSLMLKFMVSYFFSVFKLKKNCPCMGSFNILHPKTLSKSFTKYQSSCKIQLSDIHWLSYISCFDYEPTNKEVILVHQASQLKIVQ